jgi:hypothetical protein
MWILFTSRPSLLGEGLDVVVLRTWATKDSVCLVEQGDGGLWLECCVGFESTMARSSSLKAAASREEGTSASLHDWSTGVRAVFCPSYSQ